MKKKLKNIIWLLVAFSAVALLIHKTPVQTFKETLSSINWYWTSFAVLLFFTAQTLMTCRWMLLLNVHKVYISFYQAVKLLYLGLFYNNMMPGAVGGDLLKGWYITHHSTKEQRVEAVVTVFVDRLVGLIGMILVGAIASFFVGNKLSIPIGSRQVPIRQLIWTILLAMVIISIIFLSRRIRRALLLGHLLDKLPFAQKLKKIDSAIRIYRHHLPTMLLALVLTTITQGLAIVAIWMLTQALHLENVTFLQCLIIMPIIWLVSAAVPVPGGLGVMENLFIPFFALAIAPAALDNPELLTQTQAQAVALAFMNRMMICVCSLPGALVPIFGGHLPKAAEMEKELNNSQ